MNHLTHSDQPVLTAPDRCTKYWASSVAPAVAAPNPARRHLLGIWAHPDDEAYLSAALMGRTIDEGGQVTLVTLTDGEAGFPDDDPRPAEERAQQRRRELTGAMAQIGVTDLRFIGLPDGAVAERGGEMLIDTLGAIMRDVRPDVVVTFGPDGITGHDDHVHNWWAVTRAWADVGIGDLWYSEHTRTWLDDWRHIHDEFGIWMTHEPDGIDSDDAVLIIEITGRELDRKRAVLAEHRSQTTTIAAALGEPTYRSWIRQEAFRRPSQDDLAAATGSNTRRVPIGAAV